MDDFITPPYICDYVQLLKYFHPCEKLWIFIRTCQIEHSRIVDESKGS